MEQQGRTCPQCSRTISPEDTIVFGFGIVGHLDCRRPRVLSAEERTLLFIHCRDHQVAECVLCTRGFHLREVASLDSFGVRHTRSSWRRRYTSLPHAPSSTGRGGHAPRGSDHEVERGYEGLVAKDEASAYESGRTTRWLKVKQKGWAVEEDRWRRTISVAPSCGPKAK